MSNTTQADATGVLLRDSNGDVLFFLGRGAPTDTKGFAYGCIYMDQDTPTASTTLYVNAGASASNQAATFVAVTAP